MDDELREVLIESFQYRLEQAKKGEPGSIPADCAACTWHAGKTGVTNQKWYRYICRGCPADEWCTKYVDWIHRLTKGQMSIEDLVAELEAELEKLHMSG